MATQKQIDKATDNLYKAVANYVKLQGGNILVIGGVQVIDFPGSLKYNWTLGIPCTGTPPKYAAAQPTIACSGRFATRRVQVIIWFWLAPLKRAVRPPVLNEAERLNNVNH